MLAAFLFATTVLDDFALIGFVSDINEFVLFDYAKKGLLLVLCLSTASFRRIARQAFAVPSVPWGGAGWFNPHVLLITAGAFLCDQMIHQAGGYVNWRLGELELFQVPPYRDDLVRYLDLSVGLTFNSVVEELFDRAILLAALARFFPNLTLRILIAGLLFGAAHWSQGLVWVAAISAIGWLSCGLYCLTRSIIPGIVVHTLHNFIVFST